MAGRYLLLNAREQTERFEDIDEIPNPMLTYTGKQFVKEFRLNVSEIGNICNIVKEDLFSKGRRRIDLSVEQKVFETENKKFLKTLASGSFQN